VKHLLSLDVGLTTGWAVHDTRSTLLAYGEVDFAEERLVRFEELRDKWMPSWTVVEPPVIERGVLGDQLSEVIHEVKLTFNRQIVNVLPAQWKPHPLASTPCPRGTTTHMKDAIRLGVWYIAVRLQGI
jgi:hypothetical protein